MGSRRLKVVRWAAALGWMALIFAFSAQPEPFDFMQLSKRPLLGILGHMGEYCVLNALLFWALRGGREGAKGGRAARRRAGELGGRGDGGAVGGRAWPVEGEERAVGAFVRPRWRDFGLALALTMIYALSDELHQLYVPGRMFDILDLGYDLIGAMLSGVLVMRR